MSEHIIPQGILDASARGKLVVFVGAGVSRILGYPSWRTFALRQLEYLQKKNYITYYEYENLKRLDIRKILSICKGILKEKNDSADIKSFLEPENKTKQEDCKIYNDLYSFNAIYITTNYDDCLDEIAQRDIPKPLSMNSLTTNSSATPQIKEDSSNIVYLKDKLLLSKLTNGKVLHLHGSIKDTNSMVVTIVDYIKNYEKGSEIETLLKEILDKYTLLFVGYGLEEYEIIEFLVNKVSVIKGTLSHFMLYPIFEEEINLLEFQRKYYADIGIQIIPYSISKEGHKYLAIIIQEWAKQIGPISRPQNFLERIKVIDEVI